MEKFEQIAQTEGKKSVASEFWFFLSQTKKWWLVPILVILLVLVVFMWVSGSAAGPYIYSFF